MSSTSSNRLPQGRGPDVAETGPALQSCPVVSIIIPLKKDQGYLKRCLAACFDPAVRGNGQVEVIVLPDEPLGWNDPGFIQEITGPVSPARKRNRGATLARGEILAFIDDDTQPQAGWLEAALRHFADSKIGAVGGPAVTPPDDPFWAQASGAAYESWLMSGPQRRRYRPQSACDLDDWPSCNLIVRRSAFDAVGGFGTDFWPGEDTEFCLAMLRKGYRIRYEPAALIQHHRRPSLKRHLGQVAGYGLHRGYFVKRYPETSRRLPYFMPTLFILTILGLGAGIAAGSEMCGWALATSATLYLALGLVSLRKKPLAILPPALIVIFVSHWAYGIFFVRGLLAARLPEERNGKT